jgi:hypothetical protein
MHRFLMMNYVFQAEELFSELAVDLKAPKRPFKCVAIGEYQVPLFWFKLTYITLIKFRVIHVSF